MTRTIAIAAVLAAAFTLPAVASAQQRHHRPAMRGQYGFFQRIQAQYNRIDAGIADGSLTRREARRLLRREARIQRQLRRAFADGRLQRFERRRLRRLLRRQGRQISQLVSNPIYRGARYRRGRRFQNRRDNAATSGRTVGYGRGYGRRGW